MRIDREFYLNFWGSITNEKWVERDLGIVGEDFWFRSKEDRDKLKSRIKQVAENRGVCVAFAEYEGDDVRKKTVARMTLTLPDGRSFHLEYDFGYGYPEDAARFMFEEGNYSCDCNLSSFLADRYPDVPEMECGTTIAMSDLSVVRV